VLLITLFIPEVLLDDELSIVAVTPLPDAPLIEVPQSKPPLAATTGLAGSLSSTVILSPATIDSIPPPLGSALTQSVPSEVKTLPEVPGATLGTFLLSLIALAVANLSSSVPVSRSEPVAFVLAVAPVSISSSLVLSPFIKAPSDKMFCFPDKSTSLPLSELTITSLFSSSPVPSSRLIPSPAIILSDIYPATVSSLSYFTLSSSGLKSIFPSPKRVSEFIVLIFVHETRVACLASTAVLTAF
jgi:hypothetical protein